MSCKPRQLNKFISLISVSLGGALSFGSICAYRGDETFYSKLLMPFVTRFVDPELAHEACVFLTRHKLIRCQESLSAEQAVKLKTNVFNITFSNPIGVAAGFDKNSQAVHGLSHYGLGFAEVGTVTPKPQDGNPKKRIFRILQDEALINRCGFNNKGKNKDTTDISSDYLVGIEKSKDLSAVHYLVINISSPNTPGLRDIQHKKNLELLLEDVLSKMDKLAIKKPLLVKIAPDISDSQIRDIADVISKKRRGQAKVSGVILTNTTTSRPAKDEKIYKESGGLSGKPLRDMSTRVISEFYRLTKGSIPIIGVGGIYSGQDAYDKIKAGASLIQLYTSLTYEGPPIVNRIKRELLELLEQDKLTSISEAVGLNHKKPYK